MHQRTVTSILLAATTAIVAQEAPPSFSVGAILNLDAGGIPASELGTDNVPAGLADAELSLSWQPRPDVSAQVVLVGDAGPQFVDQAWGSWSPEAFRLDFGQFLLPHGIHEGRTLTDPLLQEKVETILPGVGVSWTRGAVTPSLSLASRTVEMERPSAEGEPARIEVRQELVAVPAIDLSLEGSLLARLSGQISDQRREVAAAGKWELGSLLFDAEVAFADGRERTYDLGWFAGAAWQAPASILVAARMDGLQVRNDWTRSATAGRDGLPSKGPSSEGNGARTSKATDS